MVSKPQNISYKIKSIKQLKLDSAESRLDPLINQNNLQFEKKQQKDKIENWLLFLQRVNFKIFKTPLYQLNSIHD